MPDNKKPIFFRAFFLSHSRSLSLLLSLFPHQSCYFFSTLVEFGHISKWWNWSSVHNMPHRNIAAIFTSILYFWFCFEGKTVQFHIFGIFVVIIESGLNTILRGWPKKLHIHSECTVNVHTNVRPNSHGMQTKLKKYHCMNENNGQERTQW